MNMSPDLTPDEIRKIEARRGELPAGPVDDDANPEWSAEDFAQARPPEEVLAPEVLAQFPNTRRRGRPRAEAPKQHVSVRLSPDVLAHFKAKGPGWQGYLDQALRAAMESEIKKAQLAATYTSGHYLLARPISPLTVIGAGDFHSAISPALGSLQLATIGDTALIMIDEIAKMSSEMASMVTLRETRQVRPTVHVEADEYLVQVGPREPKPEAAKPSRPEKPTRSLRR